MYRCVRGMWALQLQNLRLPRPVLAGAVWARSAHQSLGKSILYDASTEQPSYNSPASDRKDRSEKPRSSSHRLISGQRDRDDKPRSSYSRPAHGLQDRSEKSNERRSTRTHHQQRDNTPQERTPRDTSKPGFTKLKRSDPTDDTNARTTLTATQHRAQNEWLRGTSGQAHLRERLKEPSLLGWQRRKIELRLKLGDSRWEPEKRIAASSMEKIRLLNTEFPEEWTIKRLSEQFKISQESVRRILKSPFRPTEERIRERETMRKEQIHAFKEKTGLGERRKEQVRTFENKTERKDKSERGEQRKDYKRSFKDKSERGEQRKDQTRTFRKKRD